MAYISVTLIFTATSTTKTFDPEKFLDQKIKKQNKKAKVTEPDKTQNLPKSVVEALRVITTWFKK